MKFRNPVTREEAGDKTKALTDALPWLHEFKDALVVLKYGGNAMINDELKAAFAADVAFLKYSGLRPVVVHGGGPQIADMLNRFGIKSEFKGGLRVTTPETMDVVRMVLTGQVSREIVGLINQYGPLAVGMSGEDGGLFGAVRRGAVVAGELVDIGQVGDVVNVNPQAVRDLIDAGRIPVISSVAPDVNVAGDVLNVNADTAAAALAAAIGAHKLVILTDVEGIYANWPDKASIMSRLPVSQAEDMLPDASAGMAPKLEACIRAVRGGVLQTHVIDGRVPHSILLEIFTDDGVGTMITHDSRRV